MKNQPYYYYYYSKCAIVFLFKKWGINIHLDIPCIMCYSVNQRGGK